MVLSAPSIVKVLSLCLPECQAAGNVPRRTAALGHDNNPADEFVSDSSKYMRSAPTALDFGRLESLAASSPGLSRRPLVPASSWHKRCRGGISNLFQGSSPILDHAGDKISRLVPRRFECKFFRNRVSGLTNSGSVRNDDTILWRSHRA